MPCDTLYLDRLTKPQRKKQIADALAKLEAALKANTVKVKVGPQGAIAFTGTWERNGVTDVCAYRQLSAAGSAELRRAVMRAEALAGVKVNARQVAAGTHLHGDTWHKGH